MIVLSIYIATYNRKDILKKKLDDILAIQSKEFDIWVLDDCSNDGTIEMLHNIIDDRVHIIQNKERIGMQKDGVMPNWHELLERCDGRFSLHLNDRDIFYADKLPGLITFLKEHWDYSAGMCNSFSGIMIYDTPEKSLMKIPYKASHPTGIIFRSDLYSSISERSDFFKKEISYIHPHDLILGKLCENGKMFSYEKIFELADTESFAKNKSFYYKKGTEKSAWFSPQERLKEFHMFINHLGTLDFSKKVRRRKAIKIAKSYLYFCTFNYKYYITDRGQTQHYGIEKQTFENKMLVECAYEFINKSAVVLQEQGYLINKDIYKMKMCVYFCLICILKPVWDFFKKGVNRKW